MAWANFNNWESENLNATFGKVYSCEVCDGTIVAEDGKVHLRVDYKVSGIGSHSCGPALAHKCRLEEKQILFRFTVAPV